MNEHKFVRDNNSKAILNTDVSGLDQYKISRDKKIKEELTLQNCVNDISILKTDMQEIKNLLIKMSEN